ncbi:sulfite oxidase, partial [Rosa chinensis]|uniref:sulfite oxidase n=1 Tax=Rosa chinensis TaxID=74649 RepID=UPI001AD8AE4D
SLEEENTVEPGKIVVHGYAVSGGGRGIERVDVSFDGGKTWEEAIRYQKSTEVPYVADDTSSGDKCAWVLFKAEADLSHNTEIVTKAVDIAGNVQPENVGVIWNLRGIQNTSWHRVRVEVEDPNF